MLEKIGNGISILDAIAFSIRSPQESVFDNFRYSLDVSIETTTLPGTALRSLAPPARAGVVQCRWGKYAAAAPLRSERWCRQGDMDISVYESNENKHE